MLQIREALQSNFNGLAPDTPQYARLTAAIVKRVYADQQGYPGDPDSATQSESDDGGKASTAAHWIDARYIKRQAAEIDAAEKAEIAKEQAAAAAAAASQAAAAAAASEAAAAAQAASEAAAASSAAAASNASAASSASGPSATSGASGASVASAASAVPPATNGVAAAPAAASQVAARPASAAAAASAPASTVHSAVGVPPTASAPAAASSPASAKATAKKGVPSAPAANTANEAARAISTQYAVVDKWGNAVSVSLTMDAPFGAGVVVPGAGFLLNDGMDTFTASPVAGAAAGDTPSDGSTAPSGVRHGNTIAAGRRPVSPMAPTILIDGGKTVLVLGAGGAGRPDSLEGPVTQYRVISSIVYEGRPLTEAVSLPSAGADVQAVQVQGNSPVPQADPHGRGVAAVVK